MYARIYDYIFIDDIDPDEPSMILLDSFGIHAMLDACQTYLGLTYINSHSYPPHCTPIAQPLDILINHLFK